MYLNLSESCLEVVCADMSSFVFLCRFCAPKPLPRCHVGVGSSETLKAIQTKNLTNSIWSSEKFVEELEKTCDKERERERETEDIRIIYKMRTKQTMRRRANWKSPRQIMREKAALLRPERLAKRKKMMEKLVSSPDGKELARFLEGHADWHGDRETTLRRLPVILRIKGTSSDGENVEDAEEEIWYGKLEEVCVEKKNNAQPMCVVQWLKKFNEEDDEFFAIDAASGRDAIPIASIEDVLIESRIVSDEDFEKGYEAFFKGMSYEYVLYGEHFLLWRGVIETWPRLCEKFGISKDEVAYKTELWWHPSIEHYEMDYELVHRLRMGGGNYEYDWQDDFDREEAVGKWHLSKEEVHELVVRYASDALAMMIGEPPDHDQIMSDLEQMFSIHSKETEEEKEARFKEYATSIESVLRTVSEARAKRIKGGKSEVEKDAIKESFEKELVELCREATKGYFIDLWETDRRKYYEKTLPKKRKR